MNVIPAAIRSPSGTSRRVDVSCCGELSFSIEVR
jgi:hypothetical protein